MTIDSKQNLTHPLFPRNMNACSRLYLGFFFTTEWILILRFHLSIFDNMDQRCTHFLDKHHHLLSVLEAILSNDDTQDKINNGLKLVL